VVNGTTTVTDESKETVIWALILFCMLISISLIMIFIFGKGLVSRVDEDGVELLDEDK